MTSERVLKWSIVLGVVLRLVLALAYPGEITDSDEYLQLGRNIWHHGIFTRFELPPDCDPSELRSDPEFLRTPGYPLLIAAVEGLWGSSERALRLVQVVLSALELAMLVAIGRRFLGPRALTLGVAWYALHPVAVGLPRLAISEGLFNTLLVGSFLVLLRLTESSASRKAGLWWSVALGLMLAATAEVRPQAQLFLGLFLVLLLVRRPGRGTLLQSAAVVLTFALAVAPWSLRNQRQFDMWTPFGVGLWQTLWYATLPYEFDGDWDFAPLLREGDRERLSVATVAEIDPAYRALALRNLREDPWGVVKERLRRYPHLWINSRFYLPRELLGASEKGYGELRQAGNWPPMVWKIASTLVFSLAPLVLAGWAILRRWRRPWWWVPLALVPLTTGGVHLFLGICEYRYALPAVPFLALLAAAGLPCVAEVDGFPAGLGTPPRRPLRIGRSPEGA